MKLEMEGIAVYREGIKIAEAAGDYVTRDLFLQILTDEEGHQDHLETQLELIEQIGIERFIQLNAAAESEKAG